MVDMRSSKHGLVVIRLCKEQSDVVTMPSTDGNMITTLHGLHDEYIGQGIVYYGCYYLAIWFVLSVQLHEVIVLDFDQKWEIFRDDLPSC